MTYREFFKIPLNNIEFAILSLEYAKAFQDWVKK
jgi:hypothetical protein